MTTSRAHDVKRIAAAFALALLVAMAVPFPGGSADAAEDKVRTDAADLGGYTATSSAAPYSMLFYEPVFPIPVDPGEPHAEGTVSYTNARLDTGPTSRAVASSIWPGPAFGDGFATICECDQEYFAKAEARYPDGKREATAETPGGAGMKASALGLDVEARAGAGESPNEEGGDFDNVKSVSTATVKGGVANSHTVATAEGVSLLEGVITIDSVETTLDAVSDTKKGKSTGVTKVNGLTIGGQGYIIDGKGLRPVAEEKPDDPVIPLPGNKEVPGAEEIRKNLGIEVELAPQKETVDGADVSRTAGGLRISVDTSVLKKALTGNVPIGDILPDELEAQLAPVLALAPTIDYVLGRAAVRAAANPPLGIPPLPDIPPPADSPAPPADNGAVDPGPPPGLGDTAAEDASLPEITGEDSGVTEPVAEEPVAAPPPGVGTPAAAQLPALFGGLSPGLVAVGLGLAGLGGRALTGLTGAAMGGMGGALCDRGLPRRVPDLRS